MKAVDLLIVGGGPAGSATAITAATAGLRVILCEREQFPRHAAGETLHPGIEPLLDRLGAGNALREAGFLRHSGHWVTWNAPTHFVPFGADANGPWLGFQAERSVFDTILLNRAQQAGAEIWQPCRVGQPMLAGTVQGAETSHGLVRATITVDATGRRAWLSSHLHLSQTTVGPQRVAWYGYMNGVCRSRDDAPAMIADANGWTWTARVRAGHYHWTCLPFDSFRPTADWRPAEFRDLNPDGPIRGANVTWRVVDATAGPGYFIVGDAAAILDPASSHGVVKAVMTGIAAGQAAVGLVTGKIPQALAARNYTAWVNDWFRHDSGKLTEFYSRSAGDLTDG